MKHYLFCAFLLVCIYLFIIVVKNTQHYIYHVNDF